MDEGEAVVEAGVELSAVVDASGELVELAVEDDDSLDEEEESGFDWPSVDSKDMLIP